MISGNRGVHVEILYVRFTPRSIEQIADDQFRGKENKKKKIENLRKDSCKVCFKLY